MSDVTPNDPEELADAGLDSPPSSDDAVDPVTLPMGEQIVNVEGVSYRYVDGEYQGTVEVVPDYGE